jgi:hypothetical protein
MDYGRANHLEISEKEIGVEGLPQNGEYMSVKAVEVIVFGY